MLFNKLCKILMLVVLVINQQTGSFAQNIAPDKKSGSAKDTVSAGEQPDLDMRPENNIFINILGDGAIASLNYERMLFIDPEHFFIAAGAGVGLNTFITIRNDNSYSHEEYLILPHHVTGNIGKGRHFFEFGFGGAFLSGPRPQPYLPSLMAGYRIQHWNANRLQFRLFGSYPLEALEKFEILYIPVGLSVGWSF